VDPLPCAASAFLFATNKKQQQQQKKRRKKAPGIHHYTLIKKCISILDVSSLSSGL
jgi:hypothetical protein